MAVTIPSGAKRLPPPKDMPVVMDTKSESKAFFEGWWKGIAIGVVIGSGLMVAFLSAAGRIH